MERSYRIVPSRMGKLISVIFGFLFHRPRYHKRFKQVAKKSEERHDRGRVVPYVF